MYYNAHPVRQDDIYESSFVAVGEQAKESAGLKIYVLAISQDLLKSINKLPLSVN